MIDHEINPYCFFNTIFVNKQDYLNNKIERELLSHELEHIKQSHSIDVVFVELIQILYWFNPILFFYSRAVRINHEYLADNNVVQSSSDIKSYSDKLLSFISRDKNVPLTTGFNQSLTRKRLIMLTKAMPNRINVVVRISLIVNLIAVFFLLMSFKNSNALSVTTNTSKNGPEKIQQLGNDVSGSVVNKFDKYLEGDTILVSSKYTRITTDTVGHFKISKVAVDAILPFSHNENLTQTVESITFNSEIFMPANPGNGLVLLKGKEFSNGTIELDIKGENKQGQSFAGLAFHGVNDTTYDAVYFSPFNFKDPERNNYSVQYISMPENDWSKLRAEYPGKYENTVSPVPDPDGWFHATIIVNYPEVMVYVNNSESPSLLVSQINTRDKGWIGFWVGNNSEGRFKNLKITTDSNED